MERYSAQLPPVIHISTMHKVIFTILILGLLVFAGCSSKVRISGNVTFPDGEPLTVGAVCFETPENSFIGRLDKNGHYSVGENNNGDGIPQGTYTV
jgi:hypothetical protein